MELSRQQTACVERRTCALAIACRLHAHGTKCARVHTTLACILAAATDALPTLKGFSLSLSVSRSNFNDCRGRLPFPSFHHRQLASHKSGRQWDVTAEVREGDSRGKSRIPRPVSLSLFLMHALFTQRLSHFHCCVCVRLSTTPISLSFDRSYYSPKVALLFLSLSLLHAFTRMLLNENVCAIRDDQFSLICPTICASLPASFFHWCRRRCSSSCKAFPSIPSSSSSPSTLLDANSCRVSGAAIGSHSFLRPLHASPLDP